MQERIRTRYVYINELPERSNLPEKNFDAFIESIQSAIVTKMRNAVEEGTVTVLQVFAKTGCSRLTDRFNRDRVALAKHMVDKLIDMAGQGVASLEESSWGEKEMADHADTLPGLDDMHPESVGYNNIGGPMYEISISREEIHITAGFCTQEFGSWFDTTPYFEWQYRKFRFVPTAGDDATLNHFLEPFGNWIIDIFSNQVKDNMVRDFINRTAEDYLNHKN